MITCRKCGRTLPEEDFYPSMRREKYARCKSCHTNATNAYRNTPRGIEVRKKCRDTEKFRRHNSIQVSQDGETWTDKMERYRQACENLVVIQNGGDIASVFRFREAVRV